MTEHAVREIILEYFPQSLQAEMFRYASVFTEVQEIRCRIERPLILRLRQNRERLVTERLCVSELQHIVSRISQGSTYAWEEEFRQGYLTLHGGHRVGLVGKGVLEQGRIRTLKQISGLNFRIARSVPGVADKLIKRVIDNGTVQNTLLIAPPGCGKTTMLRDLIRQLSDGVAELGFSGVNVAVVDERSELAGCVNGIPQLDVGRRTDILDGCPKSEGIRLLIRSMGPQVVAADEIGTTADVAALEEALQSGVHILTTVHGNSWDDVWHHPSLGALLDSRFFPVTVSLCWENDGIAVRDEGGWLI